MVRRLHHLHQPRQLHTSGFVGINRSTPVKRGSRATVRLPSQQSLQERKAANVRYRGSHVVTNYHQDALADASSAPADNHHSSDEAPYMRNERLRNPTPPTSNNTTNIAPQVNTVSRPSFRPNFLPNFVNSANQIKHKPGPFNQ